MDERNPEIFISYGRADQDFAARVAETLRDDGYRIWWDDHLPAHRAYSEVIQERLEQARAVLAIWSADSARSQWVRAEADFARNAGKLVQISVDGTIPPIPFNQIDCPMVGDWSGGASHRGWQKVSASLSDLAGKPRLPDPRPARPVGAGKSICVLPFVNRSADPDQDYLSDGITEDVITALAQNTDLLVVARTTSFALKGVTLDAFALARQLRVDHILEGSVRKSGNRLRITAQLIDASTGHQRWTEKFDRELADAFEIQDDISQAIVRALQPRLVADSGRQSAAPDPRAYQAYLRARHCWNRGTEESLGKAVAFFTEAIRIDPGFARAHAGLADAWVSLGMHTYRDPAEAYRYARESASTALQLDPELAEAHAAMGIIAFVHDWDSREAARYLARAVELDPGSTVAGHHHSRLLSAMGRHDEAIAQAQSVVDQDPLSVAAAGQLGGALINARRFDEAIAWLRKASDLFPDQFTILYRLTFAFAYSGNPGQSLEAAEAAAGVAQRNLFSLGALGYALACAGETDKAAAILDEMETASSDRYVCPFDIAAIHAALGATEPAMQWLKRGLDLRDHAMLFAEVDPALDPLRGDERFENLLQLVWGRPA